MTAPMTPTTRRMAITATTVKLLIKHLLYFR
jgi:hypothetical protein